MPKWKCFLDYMVKKQLCSEEKADALLNYSGYDVDDKERDWPSNLRNASELMGASRRSTFIRKLSHFKIDYTNGKLTMVSNTSWLNSPFFIFPTTSFISAAVH